MGGGSFGAVFAVSIFELFVADSSLDTLKFCVMSMIVYIPRFVVSLSIYSRLIKYHLLKHFLFGLSFLAKEKGDSYYTSKIFQPVFLRNTSP